MLLHPRAYQKFVACALAIALLGALYLIGSGAFEWRNARARRGQMGVDYSIHVIEAATRLALGIFTSVAAATALALTLACSFAVSVQQELACEQYTVPAETVTNVSIDLSLLAGLVLISLTAVRYYRKFKRDQQASR
ncbi:MAG TPA: hypothetical protein VFN11_01720 [Ktedonobacterales bacterium]|nr:hypothetical protein [Ktedonobacterales bacterium]